MSIAYEAVFGIGFEVEADAELLDSLFYENECYRFEQSGNCYTGDDWRSFVFLKGDFNEITKGLEVRERDLRRCLEQQSIKIVSEFGLHGGVMIS